MDLMPVAKDGYEHGYSVARVLACGKRGLILGN